MESRWISRLQIPNPCNNLLGLHLEWNTTSDVRLLVSNLDHSCIITRGRKWRKSLITRVSKKSALQRDGEIHRKIGWSSGVEDETLQNKIDVLSFRFTIIPENRVEPRGRFSWTRKCSNPVARILVAGLSFPDTFLVFVSECRATEPMLLCPLYAKYSVLLLRHRWWIKSESSTAFDADDPANDNSRFSSFSSVSPQGRAVYPSNTN